MLVRLAPISCYLSFLLPGLGQFYVKRWVTGGVFFLCFLICLSQSALHPLLPVIAIAAGLEVLRHSDREARERGAVILYAAGGVLGFVLWFTTLFGTVWGMLR